MVGATLVDGASAGTSATDDKVTDLPKLSGGLLENNYAGYTQVSELGHLFYWFAEARNPSADADDTPVLVWLNGGPGASSLTGLLVENGPYSITANGTLVPNQLSWNERFHMLYVDNPVGTGYSYCENNVTSCYATNQSQVSEAMTTRQRLW